MKQIYRVMLGRKSVYAEEAYRGSRIGVNWIEDIDLSGKLPEGQKEFNKIFIPLLIEENSSVSKIGAGLAGSYTRTVCKGLQRGDIILMPNGLGQYYIGEIAGNYSYHKGEKNPHRRAVTWYPRVIEKTELSESLLNSMGAMGTVSNITKHSQEIEALLSNSHNAPITIIAKDESIENPIFFALEKHLEDFLIANRNNTELGKKYDIFEENGELVGQQYPSDTGPIDILAISKDKKEILVVELKRGRVSDVVIGQIQRYMGYVQEELADTNQTTKGIIIGLDDDVRIQRALKVTNNIEFYKYQISFKLMK